MRRRDERFDLLSDQLLLVVAEQPAHRGVDRVDHARRVQRDEPVRHVVEHGAHALLALLQSNFGAFALDELANLRADVVHHAQQPLVELARRPRGQRDHADDAAAASNRESDEAVEPDGQRGGRARRRILRQVGQRYGPALLPNVARQSLATAEGELTRCRLISGGIAAGPLPRDDEMHHLARPVDLPVLAELPVQRAAQPLEHVRRSLVPAG